MAALVLSGGGSLGVAHIGALRQLEKRFLFTHFYGVSAGAIVCASAACGMTAEKISEKVHELSLFDLCFDFASSHFGMIRGEKILSYLDALFDGKTFEDLHGLGKYLFVYATNFTTGERVCLNTGSIAKAVRASLSVPLLFEPFFYHNTWLVDGGLSGNLPLHEAIVDYDGEQIIAVDVATGLKPVDFSDRTFLKKPSSLIKTMERTFRIFFKTQQSYIPYDSRVDMYTPDLSAFTTLDVKKWKQIEQKGEECVGEKIII